jgi:hypothetical protein
MTEAHAGFIQRAVAKTIGTAMLLDRSHVDQQLRVNGLIRPGAEDPTNSTHPFVLLRSHP